MTANDTEPRVTLHRLGHEESVVVQIEDALPDPQELRRNAAGAIFAADAQYYPGIRAALPDQYVANYANLAKAILAKCFDHNGPVTIEGAFYAIVTTSPEQLLPAQRIPHYDAVCDKRFAIVHYLAADDLGGTGFFRHRRTGFTSITEDRQSAYFEALRNDIAEYGPPTPAYVSGDSQIFECIANFEACFNRALFYRGNLLHSGVIKPDAAFIANPSAGRLTVTCFISI